MTAGIADTIFALSSGLPPAGLAVIRISGPAARETLLDLAGFLPAARRASLRRLHDAGAYLDEALVLWFPGPATATGEDLVELHLHGSRAVVARVEAALAGRPGLRPAEPGEFTRRALLHGRIDLTEAEGLADLLRAETEAQRRAALDLTGGALSLLVHAWRERLLHLSARVEAELDFSDEDDVAAQPNMISATIVELRDELRILLSNPTVERLHDGVRVILAGPPNAGKSTLLNRLVGRDAAITAPDAGTTRDLIEVPVTIGGIPFVFVDTAGLRDAAEPVERIGVERAHHALEGADLVLWLGDDDAPPLPASARLIAIHARCDAPGRRPLRPERLAISARTGEGVATLTDRLLDEARNLLPRESEVALNRRQRNLISELVCALDRAAHQQDLLLVAEELRHALLATDRLLGRSGVEEMLDRLFAGLCIGK